jgi:hypothetical protein
LRAVDPQEDVERVLAELRASFEREARDRRGGIAELQFLREPLGFLSAARPLEEPVDADESRAREQMLDLDAPALRAQEPQELVLQVVRRREVRVAALARDGEVVAAVEDEAGGAETRPRGDHRAVPVRARRAFVQAHEVVSTEHGDAVRHRLEIVHERDLRKAELLRELARLDDPRQVRRAHAAAAHGTRDAEPRAVEAVRVRAAEVAQDLDEARMMRARIDLLDLDLEPVLLLVDESDPRVRPADVAGQDHSSTLRQRRPSRPSNSSASFGPHEPAA